MSDINATGSCLCQRVRYRITGTLGIFQNCHCSQCRKWSGSMFASNILVSPKDFEWLQGETHVGHFPLPGAKHYATAFCTHCGSSMPSLAQTGRAIVVPAGTLDDDPGIRPSQNIYCASRAIWHTDPASLPEHDELPIRKK